MDSSLTQFQANNGSSIVEMTSSFSTASSGTGTGTEPVRKLHVTFDRNSTFLLPVEEREYHTNAHTQAIAYIVIILVLYFSALTVIVVRYMRKERNQFHLPRYLMKKERSPPSPSSFRLNSGRRAVVSAPDSSAAAVDLADVTQALNTVSNQLMMDAQPKGGGQDQNSALLVPAHLTNKVQIDTTSV